MHILSFEVAAAPCPKDPSVWARLKSPPQPSETGELMLPTDGTLWRRIRGSRDTLCIILSIDGMNWGDALRVGGHNGKTIAVYITLVLGPEFLSYSSTYSVAMFAPASLLERHTRAEIFGPLMKQLALLANGVRLQDVVRCMLADSRCVLWRQVSREESVTLRGQVLCVL